MKKKKCVNLKVYKNKKNGQGIVNLPKKKFLGRKLPDKVRVTW